MAVFDQLVLQHLNQHTLSSQLLLHGQQQVDQAGFIQLVVCETNRTCLAL